MAYVSGTASTMLDLKSAIESESVARGWSLSNGILSKNGCFFKLSSRETASSYLAVYAGTGQSGSDLTGGAPDGVAMMSNTGQTFSFPLSYEIFGFDDVDEIYCVINYNSNYYQVIAFGKSGVSGIGGTGAWITGTTSAVKAVGSGFNGLFRIVLSQDSLGIWPLNSTVGSLFFTGVNTTASSSQRSSFIHVGLDSSGWITEQFAGTGNFYGMKYASSLLTSLPNKSNQSSPLIPIKAIKYRESGGLTIVVNLANARYMRIDNIDSGGILTIGSDQWKCYPFLRKDASVRNGDPSNDLSHSGTFGYAIRYQGP